MPVSMSNSSTEVARFKLIFTKFAYNAKKVQKMHEMASPSL